MTTKVTIYHAHACCGLGGGAQEVREIAARFPEHLERISEWEFKVSQCSKRGYSTFFHKVDGLAGSTPSSIFSRCKIEEVVLWSRTSRGGRQYDLLLAASDEPSSCSSAYGLCA